MRDARAEPPDARRTVGIALGALALYAAVALLLTAAAWASPTTHWAGSCCDPEQTMWYLRWIPTALGQGTNPLLTDALNAPDGVNLMWNTPTPLVALAVAPVTAIGGPVLAYNVALTGAIALSAWAAFLAFRHVLGGVAGPLVGGLVYGLSPYMASHAALHLDLVAAWAPPLFLVLVLELLAGRRHRPAVLGAAIGVLAGLQVLTFEELLATSAVAAAALAVVLALTARDRDAVRAGIGRIVRAAVPALACFVLVAGLPLAVQFLGPLRITAPVQDPSAYATDLLNVVLPTPYQLVAPSVATDISREFSGLYHEATAYVGLPLLVVLAVAVVVRWSDRRIRVAGLTGLVMLVLSLGPVLHVGTVATGVPLPWLPFSRLPLLEHAVPGRLTLYAWLAIAAIVAILVDTVAAWPARRAIPGLAALGAALLLVAPAPLVSSTVEVPEAFRQWDRVGIDRDAVVLFAPHFTNGAGAAPMLWAAVADDPPRMREAYAFVPAADGTPHYGPPPTQLTQIMDAIQDSGTKIVARGEVRAQALADIAEGGITDIVVGPMDHRAAMVAFFTDLLGRAPEQTLGVDVWRDVGPGR